MAIAGKYADLLHLIGEFSVGIVAEFAQLKERFITHDKEIATLRASVATLESAHNKLAERCKILEEANIALCEKNTQLEQCYLIDDINKKMRQTYLSIEQMIEDFIMHIPFVEPCKYPRYPPVDCYHRHTFFCQSIESERDRKAKVEQIIYKIRINNEYGKIVHLHWEHSDPIEYVKIFDALGLCTHGMFIKETKLYEFGAMMSRKYNFHEKRQHFHS